ncbi:hypothetical protein BDZ89DRAFT_583404 [Hymenopellis radicata]|nr:hypothetical protein BDZ89DRAFT_583404 [Hymenopellis radicata]
MRRHAIGQRARASGSQVYLASLFSPVPAACAQGRAPEQHTIWTKTTTAKTATSAVPMTRDGFGGGRASWMHSAANYSCHV